jgi:hypothetical protein
MPSERADIPQTICVQLAAVKESELGFVRDASYVGSEKIRDSVVSITVTDTRNGRYPGNRDVPRDACVILLKFGFASNFGKRIATMTITVAFSPAEEPAAGGQPSSPIPPIPSPPRQIPGGATAGAAPAEEAEEEEQEDEAATPVPEVRLYEPSSGQGKSTTATVSVEGSAQLSLGGGLGVGIGGKAHRATRTKQTAATTLQSMKEDHGVVVWRLDENQQAQDGIPSELNCAVVLRTGGQPFVASVQFRAKIESRHWSYSGRGEAFIASSHFRHRRSGLSVEEQGLLENMDSDDFLAWVRGKASNAWIVSRAL